jgi:hypothetical protein
MIRIAVRRASRLERVRVCYSTMGKRADVVFIAAGIVFVIEFKVGSEQFDTALGVNEGG